MMGYDTGLALRVIMQWQQWIITLEGHPKYAALKHFAEERAHQVAFLMLKDAPSGEIAPPPPLPARCLRARVLH